MRPPEGYWTAGGAIGCMGCAGGSGCAGGWVCDGWVGCVGCVGWVGWVGWVDVGWVGRVVGSPVGLVGSSLGRLLDDVVVSTSELSDEVVVGVVDRVVVVDRCVAVADLEVFEGFGGVRCELVSASPSSGAASGAGMAKARTEPSARRTTEIGAMNRQRRSRTAEIGRAHV